MFIASGKSHPTYLYNLCGHILSSVQIAKHLGITLTDELSWSSHVHLIHSHANSTLGFLRRNLRRCPAKLKENVYIMFEVPSHMAAMWLIRILATRQAQTARYHSKWSHVANYSTVT